jgi:hypothetical protein
MTTKAFASLRVMNWVIFYLKLGYAEFGRLPGFSGKYDRHYLHKRLDAMEHV